MKTYSMLKILKKQLAIALLIQCLAYIVAIPHWASQTMNGACIYWQFCEIVYLAHLALPMQRARTKGLTVKLPYVGCNVLVKSGFQHIQILYPNSRRLSITSGQFLQCIIQSTYIISCRKLHIPCVNLLETHGICNGNLSRVWSNTSNPLV